LGIESRVQRVGSRGHCARTFLWFTQIFFLENLNPWIDISLSKSVKQSVTLFFGKEMESRIENRDPLRLR